MEELERGLEDRDQWLEDVRCYKHFSGGPGRRSRLEQALALDGIKPTVAEGVAAQQPPDGEDQPAEYAESADRLDRVFRAGGVVLAVLAESR
jgi:hypothetical protein